MPFFIQTMKHLFMVKTESHLLSLMRGEQSDPCPSFHGSEKGDGIGILSWNCAEYADVYGAAMKVDSSSPQ
jgi:hypothetical protein